MSEMKTGSASGSRVTRTILMCAAALVAALALLLLVPSSPALLVDEPQVLALLSVDPSAPALMVDESEALMDYVWEHTDDWGNPDRLLLITGYGAFIAVGALAALAVTAVLSHVKGLGAAQGMGLGLLSGVCALLGSHWMYCALRWGYIVNDLGGSWLFPLEFMKGGYTMYGAILGGLLGAVIWARLRRVSVGQTMDVLIPGLLLLLCIGRYGEMMTAQGMANTRAAEALQMMPFAFEGEWGDPELAVFVYEALAALAALITAAVILWRGASAGRAAECGLAIVSAYQIMLDSMRGDELIRFGFVCLNMIAAAVVLAFILLTRILRRVREGGWRAWETVRVILFALGCGLVIVVEFALDGKIKMFDGNNTALYVLDVLAVTGMMLSVTIADGRGCKAAEKAGEAN